MPITLHPISRRQFIVRSLAAGAAAFALPELFGKETKTDPHRFALLADTHICANRGEVVRGINMTDNLEHVGSELVSLDTTPSSVFILGDLAYLTGESGDYATLVALLEKIRAAGLPIHLTLGNHDERDRFWKAIPPKEGADKPVENRTVAIIKSKRANLFILDSLRQTNETPGFCGEVQLKWLAAALDAHADKPAITMIHHNFDGGQNVSGLVDTKALLDVILPRKHVKAHFFGHTHDWHVTVNEGLHLVNLPPTAYVFAKGRPNGWVDMKLENDSARLELHTIDPTHADNHQQKQLAWR